MHRFKNMNRCVETSTLSQSTLQNIFHYSKDVTGYCGCNINRLFVPRVFTNFGKIRFFFTVGLSYGTIVYLLWNNLSSKVVECHHLDICTLINKFSSFVAVCLFFLSMCVVLYVCCV